MSLKRKPTQRLQNTSETIYQTIGDTDKARTKLNYVIKRVSYFETQKLQENAPASMIKLNNICIKY